MQNINPTQTAAWQFSNSTIRQIATAIAELFAQQPDRFKDYSLTFDNQILVDFFQNNINQETLNLLRQLAKECALDEAKTGHV